MLTLTLPNGATLTAPTDVQLAARYGDVLHGTGWDEGLCPFDEHTIMGDLLDTLAAISDGNLPGHTLTDTTLEGASAC